MNPFYKTFFLLFLNSLVLIFNSFSQVAPGIEWQRCFGGTSDDKPESIQQTIDGGYVVAGSVVSSDGDVTGNHGSYDYWIIKLDGLGNLQWQKCFGGSSQDHAKSVSQTLDSGYIVAGYVLSVDSNVSGNHGSYDYWVIKLNNVGNLQWQKCFGGSYEDQANFIIPTLDSGYIVAGYSESNNGDVSGHHGGIFVADNWIVKMDNSGNLQWEKSFGGTAIDNAESIKQTSDSGYIVAGKSVSNDGDVSGNHGGNGDFWIIKIDPIGNLQWQKCLGGTSLDWSESISQTIDGGYIASGFTGSNDGDVSGFHGVSGGDMWVVKMDSAGTIQWQKCLGGTLGDYSYDIKQTQDSGYIVAGISESNNGDVTGNHSGAGDFWIVKLDFNGNLKLQKCFGGTFKEAASSIQQTTDGGYIICGWAGSIDGDVIGNHGPDDYWIIKLAPDTITSIPQFPNPQFPFSISPNPSPRIFQITFPKSNQKSNYTLKISNTLGQTVFSSDFRLPASDFQTKIDVSFLPKGIYVLKIISEKEEFTSKLVKE